MTVQYVPDSDDPHAIVRGYLDALARTSPCSTETSRPKPGSRANLSPANSLV
jgi:hypothetical protein